MCEWLTRWRNTRGYGVQSPTDYRFLKYVIRERGEYYAYASLCTQYALRGHELKKGKLFFRIANALQPDVLCDLTKDAAQYAPFFSAGCVGMKIRGEKQNEEGGDVLETAKDGEKGKCALLRLSCRDHSCEEIKALLKKLPGTKMMILEDVAGGGAARECYRALLAMEEISITFNLQSFALCFLTPGRYKQTYFVYF